MSSQAVFSYCPTTWAANGIGTSTHYSTTQAGLKRRNAIAAASILAVVYPHINSIGIDTFQLISNQKTKEVKC